jgi:ribonuclease T2
MSSNGSYTQYCDLSRQYDPIPSPNTTNGLPNGTVVPVYNGSSIDTFVEAFGRYDLLAWMNKHWIAQTGPNHVLWAHEFSKHATCFSTFDIPCYGPKYVKHQDVVDYFETVIYYYRQLPTWNWLAQHEILPSNTTAYTKSDLEDALTQEYGSLPYLGCSGPRYNETEAGRAANTTDTGRTVLSEVWYFMHVNGRPQDGRSVSVDTTTRSGCTNATDALWYYEQTAQNATMML